MLRTASLKNFNLIVSLILAIFATSCTANFHLRRAIKKGYSCEGVSDTIRISTIDSIPYVLRDSIAWEKVLVQKDTIIRYKRSFVPKTRLETRIEYRLKRDTLRMIEKVEVVKWKTEKHRNVKPNILFLVLGFVMGFVTYFLLRHFKNPL